MKKDLAPRDYYPATKDARANQTHLYHNWMCILSSISN